MPQFAPPQLPIMRFGGLRLLDRITSTSQWVAAHEVLKVVRTHGALVSQPPSVSLGEYSVALFHDWRSLDPGLFYECFMRSSLERE